MLLVCWVNTLVSCRTTSIAGSLQHAVLCLLCQGSCSAHKQGIGVSRQNGKVCMGMCRGPGQMARHLLRGGRAPQPGAGDAGQQRLRPSGALAQQHCEMLACHLPGLAVQCMSFRQHHANTRSWILCNLGGKQAPTYYPQDLSGVRILTSWPYAAFV